MLHLCICRMSILIKMSEELKTHSAEIWESNFNVKMTKYVILTISACLKLKFGQYKYVFNEIKILRNFFWLKNFAKVDFTKILTGIFLYFHTVKFHLVSKMSSLFSQAHCDVLAKYRLMFRCYLVKIELCILISYASLISKT